MGENSTERKPSQFAEERFEERKRAWLRRIWWLLPIAAVLELALFVAFGAHLSAGAHGVLLGTGIGVAVTLVMVLADSPPHHIERWRQGAQGEQQTARVLRRLVKQGWTLIHDIERDRGGNIDHVLIGSTGIYVLETKNPGGRCSVSNGVLSVRWREDPTDGYEKLVGSLDALGAPQLSFLDLPRFGGHGVIRRPGSLVSRT